MKSLQLLLISICFLSTKLYSQDCKYSVNKEDKFTNTITQEIEPVELCSILKNDGMVKLKNISMMLRTENGKRYFTLAYTMGGTGGIPVFVGNAACKLILLLADGSKIELSMAGLMSDSKQKNALKHNTLTHFELTEDNYFKLKAQNITDVRAVAMVNPFDFKIKDGVNTSFYFSCIK